LCEQIVRAADKVLANTWCETAAKVLANIWWETWYCLVVCCTTNGAHAEIYLTHNKLGGCSVCKCTNFSNTVSDWRKKKSYFIAISDQTAQCMLTIHFFFRAPLDSSY
jgi:hypothetical protein